MDRPVVLVVTRRPEAWLPAEEHLKPTHDFHYLSRLASRPSLSRPVALLVIDRDAHQITQPYLGHLLEAYQPAATMVIGAHTLPEEVFAILLAQANYDASGTLWTKIKQRFRKLGSHHTDTELPGDTAVVPVKDQPLQPAHVRPEVQLYGSLLGPFHVSLGTLFARKWPQQKARSLFAYLLHRHEEATPRERLMQMFWPLVDEHSARNSLNVAINAIRGVLRPLGLQGPIIRYEDHHYQIDPTLPLQLDTESFRLLSDTGFRIEQRKGLAEAAPYFSQALELYKGPFLQDEKGEWPLLERERLADLEVVLMDRMSRHFALQGAHEETIRFGQQVVDKDPCREDAHRRLILAFYLNGQREKAIRQYLNCRQILNQQLEIDVSHDTRRLFGLVKKDDFQAILDDYAPFNPLLSDL